MPHIYVSKSGQHWFRLWFVAYSPPIHYLNYRWFNVAHTLKFQSKFRTCLSRKCIWKYRARNGGYFVYVELTACIVSLVTLSQACLLPSHTARNYHPRFIPGIRRLVRHPEALLGVVNIDKTVYTERFNLLSLVLALNIHQIRFGAYCWDYIW